MNSKIVTKEINSIIRPLLKENGFKKYTGRTYWRHHSDRIDILNFQSFNDYNASVIGCTTYSFAVNLATFLKYVPSQTEIKEKNGIKKPAEYQGHFRRVLTKGMGQRKLKRKDIWFIDDKGENLTKIVSDCKNQIENEGIKWYNQFETKEKVFGIILDKEIEINGTWGFGNYDSPMRNELVAYTALEIGKFDLAIKNLNKLLEYYKEEYKETKYDFYKNKWKHIKAEIKKIKTTHNTV